MILTPNIGFKSVRGKAKQEPTSYDVDFQAKIDYADANSIPKPDETQLAIENQRLLNYKAIANGAAWDRDSVYFDPIGVTDQFIDWRLICTKRRVQMQAFGGLIWDAQGVEGNGTDAYIDPLLEVSTDANFTLTDAGIMYYSRKMPTELKAVYSGYDGTNGTYILYAPKINADPDAYAFINGGQILQSASFVTTGLNGLYRQDSGVGGSNVYVMSGDNSESFSHTPGSLISGSPLILARNRVDTSSVDLFSTEKIGFMTIGGSKQDLHVQLNTLTY